MTDTDAKHRQKVVNFYGEDSNIVFFYDHAGYSFEPDKESREQGRLRCAVDLANAEAEAKARGWYVTWQDDIHNDDGSTEKHNPIIPIKTCELAVLKDEDAETLASVGCIDDATPEYHRVIEAELALEALDYEHQREEKRSTTPNGVTLPKEQMPDYVNQTFAEQIESLAADLGERGIQAVVIGKEGIEAPAGVTGRPLNWTKARGLLDYKYCAGYGSAGCHSIYAWTENYVIFVSQYDGATRLNFIPRNPTDVMPDMPGGG